MFKNLLRIAAVWTICVSTAALAQNNNGKLALLIPNLFGPRGLELPNPGHLAHFDSAFQTNFGPLNKAVASQIASIPIPSPASGFTYAFDPALGVYSRSAQSFGPILSERAETIGKGKFSFGFSFQRFGFDRLDGLNLNRVPAVFVHAPDDVTPPRDFVKDVITTDNFIGLQVNQFTPFFTFGLSNRFDMSVAFPIVNTKLNVVSNATIRRIGSEDPLTHTFVKDLDRDRQQFSKAGSASGIGDILVRFKGTAVKREHAGLAFGLDVRLPTGDEFDLLGSGAVGIKPFAALSFPYKRVSPHLNFGYQWNGNSVLAGDVRTGEKRRLPDQIFYLAGIDIGVTEKFTLAFDVLGQRIIDAERVSATTFTTAPDRTGRTLTFPQIDFRRRTLNLADGSIGFKVNPVGSLLVSFNVLFKLNDSGLREKVTPLIGVAYTF